MKYVTPKHQCPLGSQLRSRECYVLYHPFGRRLYLWMGSKVTQALQRAAKKASKLLRKRSAVTCLLSFVTIGECYHMIAECCYMIGECYHMTTECCHMTTECCHMTIECCHMTAYNAIEWQALSNFGQKISHYATCT